MSDESKKKYICKLPTNGYNTGDEAFLTEDEVANFNGGEVSPRFVLADEVSAADAPVETSKEETPSEDANKQPEAPAATTPGGEYVEDDKKPEDAAPGTTGDAPASTDTTSASSEAGVQ